MHLVLCFLCVLNLLLVAVEIFLYVFLYYIKNPLNTSYMAQPNQYYLISKSALKLVLPIFFLVDYTLSLEMVYKWVLATLLGGYIFWHRLFSIHSYCQRHFYIEYFMEVFLFWVALNHAMLRYITENSTESDMLFIYILIAASSFAVMLVAVEKKFQQRFFDECLLHRVKKQNMEKFIFLLID